MGWHYRKSIKVGPFRINLSRHGVSHTFGNRRVHISSTPDGRRHVTFRLPGGFHVSKTLGGRRRRHYY